jgi:hypothetical protein
MAALSAIDTGGIALDTFQQGDRHSPRSFAAARALGLCFNATPRIVGLADGGGDRGVREINTLLDGITPEACRQCHCRATH